jgi:hypothetical protein
MGVNVMLQRNLVTLGELYPFGKIDRAEEWEDHVLDRPTRPGKLFRRQENYMYLPQRFTHLAWTYALEPDWEFNITDPEQYEQVERKIIDHCKECLAEERRDLRFIDAL